MKTPIIFRVCNRLKTYRFLAVIIPGMLFCACNDAFDKHYEADENLVSGKNLWATLESMPELSTFTGLLKEFGYDEILSQSQSYTVFAPNNDALAALDTVGIDVKKEFIQNHIARFFIPASYGSERIAMLNKKRMELSGRDESGQDVFQFGLAPFVLPAESKAASNGIVHLLSAYNDFMPNIWESLDKEPGLDSVKNYMYSFDEIEFAPELSVPGNIVDGEQTYLDSVFVNNNFILNELGAVDVEDSTYVVLMPDNTAWIEAFNRVKSDFVFYRNRTAAAAALQRKYTTLAMVNDLFFSSDMQRNDSLLSTSGNAFHRETLLAGARKVTTSNGDIYVTGNLKIKDTESWHKPIKVEAERVRGRENLDSEATPYIRVGDATMISNGQYLSLQTTGPSANPDVTFSIPNTLSSTYNIYCVFVSDNSRPYKVRFGLNFMKTNGRSETQWFPSASGTIETDYTKAVDTICVATNITFPVSGVDEYDSAVKLKVLSKAENTLNSRNLMIDCILFEPVTRP